VVCPVPKISDREGFEEGIRLNEFFSLGPTRCVGSVNFHFPKVPPPGGVSAGARSRRMPRTRRSAWGASAPRLSFT
jgi:hypothetical protein